MAEGKMAENHLTSAAAFVEGGIQDACDDACSICLEDFCDSEPSTLTTCKHEFHLQCILEWCQRSSQCPMCWQAISLKDPDSQELLDAVEHERNLQMNPPRNTTIFHHPTLGDFELQHLPVNATESELEERILQHLAAAAAMGRARHLARREGHRTRSSAHARPQFLVFSTHSNGVSTTPSAAPVSQIDNSSPPAVMLLGSNSSVVTVGEDSTRGITQSSPTQSDRLMATAIGSSAGANEHGISNSRCPNQTIPHGQDRSGPSDLQSFSESVKSRIGALSMRCKESISKSTRGWKEKLFARNNSTPDPITEVRRDVAGVSSLRDHLEIAEDSRPNISMVSHNSENSSTQDHIEQQTVDGGGYPSLNEEDPRASRATSSAPNTNAAIAMRL